jgi:hypothetical protein
MSLDSISGPVATMPGPTEAAAARRSRVKPAMRPASQVWPPTMGNTRTLRPIRPSVSRSPAESVEGMSAAVRGVRAASDSRASTRARSADVRRPSIVGVSAARSCRPSAIDCLRQGGSTADADRTLAINAPAAPRSASSVTRAVICSACSSD